MEQFKQRGTEPVSPEHHEQTEQEACWKAYKHSLKILADHPYVTDAATKKRADANNLMKELKQKYELREIVFFPTSPVGGGMATELSMNDGMAFYECGLKSVRDPHEINQEIMFTKRNSLEYDGCKFVDVMNDVLYNIYNGKPLTDKDVAYAAPIFSPSLNEFKDHGEEKRVDALRKKVLENLKARFDEPTAKAAWDAIAQMIKNKLTEYDQDGQLFTDPEMQKRATAFAEKRKETFSMPTYEAMVKAYVG